MTVRITGAELWDGSVFRKGDLFYSNGIFDSGKSIFKAVTLDFSDCVIFPGFADVHVHLREPGFSYKETMSSGTAAAAGGGYTAVCPMPNLSPVPDSPEHLAEELAAIARDGRIGVYPYGALTVGEKGLEHADLAGLAGGVIAFSDDGKGVQSESMMRESMTVAKRLGRLIAAHCEDESLLFGGYIHDGAYARSRGHKGICSESEWRQVERDLRLVRETGCAYHVCHVSTKESVALIRAAKAEGLDVTCETAPHYLLLTEDDLREDGRFKMNPPLRERADREALLEGLRDGTVDIIATDHAPHSAEEKAKGLSGSAMGVVGLETAFPMLYTYLVRPGLVSLERVLDALITAPRRRFGIPGGTLNPGESADFTVFDLNERYTVDPTEFLTKGRATPFAGREAFGRCRMTVYRGETVFRRGGNI